MEDSAQKPIVYIVHGDDLAAIEQFVAGFLAHITDLTTADFNITRLDGRQASLEDLRNAVMVLSFFAERRIVVFRNPLARIDKNNKTAQQRFIEILNQVPPSTALVLPIEDRVERKDWVLLPEKKAHWLRAWMSTAGSRLFYKVFNQPQIRMMPGWIMAQAAAMGGRFTQPAAQALTTLLGNDTRIAGQEIRKLLESVDYKRPVEQEDVELLTAFTSHVDIFEIVDALAEGNASKAQRLMHLFLETSPEGLFGMVVRQFRLLIQVRETLDEGLALAQVMREVGQVEYVTRKLVGQAQRFTLARLEALYHQLLEIDEALKTSQMDLETALDLLVVEVSR